MQVSPSMTQVCLSSFLGQFGNLRFARPLFLPLLRLKSRFRLSPPCRAAAKVKFCSSRVLVLARFAIICYLRSAIWDFIASTVESSPDTRSVPFLLIRLTSASILFSSLMMPSLCPSPDHVRHSLYRVTMINANSGCFATISCSKRLMKWCGATGLPEFRMRQTWVRM
jgi:hypothetical protein